MVLSVDTATGCIACSLLALLTRAALQSILPTHTVSAPLPANLAGPTLHHPSTARPDQDMRPALVSVLLLAACCCASVVHARQGRSLMGYVDPDDTWRVCRAYVPNVNYYKCQECESSTRCKVRPHKNHVLPWSWLARTCSPLDRMWP